MLQKYFLDDIKMAWKDLSVFFISNRWIYTITVAIFVLIYGKQFYNFNVRIDSALFLIEQGTPGNWLQIGRQGGILTDYLFAMRYFNPYFVATFGFILIIFSVFLIAYFFNKFGNIQPIVGFSIGLLFYIHPMMMEAFYFTMMIFKIGIIFLILPSIIALCYVATLYNRKYLNIFAILFSIWSFSTYQSFCILYICYAIFCFLIIYRKNEIISKNSLDCKIYWKLIFNWIFVFAFSMAINYVITKTFFHTSLYLDGQIQWKLEALHIGFFNILKHIRMAIFGESIYYSCSFIISAFLMLFYVILGACKCKKGVHLRWLYILSAIGFQLCPFLLTIYLGRIPFARAQWAYPFVIACNFGFLLSQSRKATSPFYSKKVIHAMACITVITFWMQTQAVMRQQYTDDVRMQEDCFLTLQIMEKINQLDTNTNLMAFVGSKQSNLNAACTKGEIIGQSIYSGNSSRIIRLFKAMGFEYGNVTQEQSFQARMLAQTMPIWPSPGSILDVGDFIVVKLGEDDRYLQEIGGVQSKMLDFAPTANSIDVNYSVDTAKIDENILKIQGWIMPKSSDSYRVAPKVYLVNENADIYISIPTGKQKRVDIDRKFEGKGKFIYSGFVAKAILSDLPLNYTNYKIILGYQTSEEEILVDTNLLLENIIG